jgi:hypothetical protein
MMLLGCVVVAYAEMFAGVFLQVQLFINTQALTSLHSFAS